MFLCICEIKQAHGTEKYQSAQHENALDAYEEIAILYGIAHKLAPEDAGTELSAHEIRGNLNDKLLKDGSEVDIADYI